MRFLYLELAFQNQDDIPTAVTHRFNLLAASNPGATEPSPMTYVIAPVGLAADDLLTLAPPLSGLGWIDFNGAFNNLIVHRGSIQTVNGGFHLAQRYAIDYMRLNDAGQIVAGDPTDVTANVAYGADVLAVADATVVEVLDELPDQPPGTLPDPASITMDTVDGNHIVLDLGGGRCYGFYAHGQKGSVLVHPGDTVQTGQVMAKLGNSGNTSAPHLHFHVMDGPSVLGSDGIPYVIEPSPDRRQTRPRPVRRHHRLRRLLERRTGHARRADRQVPDEPADPQLPLRPSPAPSTATAPGTTDTVSGSGCTRSPSA